MDFIRNLPKIELHAHLNGSLSNKTLLRLHDLKYGKNVNENSEINDFYKIIEEKSICLADCFKKFKYAHDLTDSKDALSIATEMVIKEFNEENVIYLELRTTPRQTDRMSKEEYLQTVVKTILKCESLYTNIMVKLIPSIDRSQGLESAKENIELVIKMKNMYPNIIKGVDLSGNPNCGEFSIYQDVLDKARQNGLRLALHCGEIQNVDEINAMLNFGMDRIGHGTFIDELNEKAWDLMVKKKIPIECCLTSNVKCQTVASYENHHFKHLFDMNHPVVICTDDSGVFDTSLTNELEICSKIFKLENKDLIKLSENAINYSFTTEKEKERLLNILYNYKIKN